MKHASRRLEFTTPCSQTNPEQRIVGKHRLVTGLLP